MAEADDIGQNQRGQPKVMPGSGRTSRNIASGFTPASRKAGGLKVFGPGLVASTHLALEHRRLFVLLPVLAIGGLGAAVGLPYDPVPIALIIVWCGLLAALIGMRQHFGLWQVLVALLAVWSGFCLPSLHGSLSGGPMLVYPAYGQYHMTVDEVVSADAGVQRVIVSDIKPESGARALPIKRARVFVRGGPILGVGDEISGNFRFAPVPAPVVPGGFDFQFHGYFAGIGSYASSTGSVSVTRGGGAGIGRWLEDMRRGIGLRLDAALEQPAQGVARALIIGDQSQIDDDTRNMMAAAGLAHVLAISGLHLTLVAGGVFAAVRLGLSLSYGLGQALPLKKLAAMVGGATALFYLALSGASVSAIRATIMLLLVFGAVLVGRRALTMRNVAIAALIVMALDPAAVFRPGYQLSFAAVAALIAIYEMTIAVDREHISGFGRVGRFFGGMALTSIIAGLATLLFAVYHFQQTAPLGVLGNIAALPIVGFVVLPASFIAVLLMPFGLEEPMLGVMSVGTEFILAIARQVATWSAPFAAAPLLNSWSLIIGLVALGWLVFFPTRLRFASPLAVIPMVWLFGLDVRPDVLVADSSQAIAVRLDEKMELISGRAPSFATNVWQETYMEPIAKAGPATSCDGAACIAQSSMGFSIAMVKRQDAFAEDCHMANLLVTRLDAPLWCRDLTHVIDRQDLRLGGVHWLKWDAAQNSFETRRSIPNQNRAWRVPF